MSYILHTIHTMGSARSFILPVVQESMARGVNTELLAENGPFIDDGHSKMKKMYLLSSPFGILFSFVAYLWGLNRRPRALIAHQTLASTLPLLSGVLLGVRTRVYYNHGIPALGHSGIVGGLLWAIDRVNIALSTHSRTVSYGNLRDILRVRPSGFRSMRVIDHGSICGVEIPNRHISKSLFCSYATDVLTIGYVGRPNGRKGFWWLVRCVSIATDVNVRVMVAGFDQSAVCDDPRFESLPEAIKERFSFLGYLEDMSAIYDKIDVLACVSQHEGMPYAVLESYAHGVPVIGSNVPGTKDIVINQRTGWLVEYLNDADLVSVIRNIYRHRGWGDWAPLICRRLVEKYYKRSVVAANVVTDILIQSDYTRRDLSE